MTSDRLLWLAVTLVVLGVLLVLLGGAAHADTGWNGT